MGCDGGTIPTRDELVKLKKRPEQKDSDGHRLYKWQHCAITQHFLSKPVVACEMGRLYSKEAVIGKITKALSQWVYKPILLQSCCCPMTDPLPQPGLDILKS